MDVDEEEARDYASIVMDLFGFHDRIIDNVLEQKDRQLFYALEAKGLLHTHREEITLHNGRQWRIHYWILKKDNIRRYSERRGWEQFRKQRSESREPAPEDIYSYLSKDIWSSRKNTIL